MKNLQYYLIETAAEMKTVKYISFSKKRKKKIMKNIRYHLEETAAGMNTVECSFFSDKKEEENYEKYSVLSRRQLLE